LRIPKRDLQNLSGLHEEEVADVAHVLPIETDGIPSGVCPIALAAANAGRIAIVFFCKSV
jgi:hypothetical protein